jgi:hypothetical protein
LVQSCEVAGTAAFWKNHTVLRSATHLQYKPDANR